jgi:hypothetical protein
MDFEGIEYVARCFGDESECFVRDSIRSSTGCVVEVRFHYSKNAHAFCKYIVKFVQYGQVKMRVKDQQFWVSVPV